MNFRRAEHEVGRRLAGCCPPLRTWTLVAHSLGVVTRAFLTTAALLFAGALALRAEITLPVPTDAGSNVTIKLASPATSVPHFGFLPVRVSIENLAASEGVWRLRFEAGNRTTFPGSGASTFEVTVPASQTREVWFFVPLVEPGISNPGLGAATPWMSSASSPGTPAIPPLIDTVYPNSPAGVSRPIVSVTNLPNFTAIPNVTTLTGPPPPVTGAMRTFTITQIGPAAALPVMATAKLPANTTQTVSAPSPSGQVTRTTVVSVDLTSTASGLRLSSSSQSPQLVATANGRAKLQAANLMPAGVTTRTSSYAGPGNETIVIYSQFGPAADLPPVDLKRLPAGFTSVSVVPQGANSVTREFTYSETIPSNSFSGTAAGSTVSGPAAGGGTGFSFTSAPPGVTPPGLALPSVSEAEARKILAPTGLLAVPSSVVTSNSNPRTIPIPITAGGRTTFNQVPIATFEQTGPALALPLPRAGSLPPGVTVTLHPAVSGGVNVTRVIVVVDPALIAMLRANLAASASRSSSNDRMSLSRIELMRLGYLRNLPNVSQNSGTPRSSSGTPGATGPDLIIYTESGPSNLLPAPNPGILPDGITCTVTPGALPGDVSRNFIVNVNTLSHAVAVPRGTASAGRAATIGGGLVHSVPTFQPTALAIEVSGPGVPTGQTRIFFPSIAPSPLPPMAISASLESAVRAKLVAASIRAQLNFAPVEPAQLPADWRVWSSFNSALLKADDFAALDAGRRAALHGWVALGGLLYLSPTIAGEASTQPLGAGRIETLAEPVDEMDARDVAKNLPLTGLSPGMPNRDDLRLNPRTPMGAMARFEPASILWISLLLIAFAVLIGPVNLYLLAPLKKRHRLFLFTPLISLVGAAAVTGAIVLQDGLGGEGIRRALVVLIPGENQAAVFQEQATHTGFLTGRDFPLNEDVLCAILPTDEALSGGMILPTSFARDRNAASGDWFRNRSRQAHLLRALTPTRARIEFVETTPAGAPIVESTLATELTHFRLRDGQGNFWTADSVGPGRRTTLNSDSRFTAAAAISKEFGGNGSPNLAEVLNAAALVGPWQWTAHGGATDLAPIKTLATIRWGDDDIVYTGLVERPAAAKDSASAASAAVEKGGE